MSAQLLHCLEQQAEERRRGSVNELQVLEQKANVLQKAIDQSKWGNIRAHSDIRNKKKVPKNGFHNVSKMQSNHTPLINVASR